jgi:cytochrome c oxidase subunit 4
MSHHDHAHAAGHDEHGGAMHFSENKVFLYLLVLTVLEVGWGLAGKHFGWNRAMLWGGLLFFAFYKGWLIAVYFMHLKFEGWVVKSLILPTPFLVLVIFGYVMPDVADGESNLVYPVGSELDPKSGEVIQNMSEGWQAPRAHAPAPAGAGH